MRAKMDLLRQCDAVLSCKAVTGDARKFWSALREKAQPSFGNIFADMFK